MLFEGDRIMTKKWLAGVAFLGAILFAVSVGDAAYQGGGVLQPTPPAHGRPAAAGPKQPNETYAVVQVGEDIKVVSNSEKATLKKRADDDYKADLKKYNDDKKNKNNHDASTSKKPDKKDYEVKILKANIKTQDEAQKFADEKNKERDKGGAKKTSAANNW